MAPSHTNKRKFDASSTSKRPKKFRKQDHYSSGSDSASDSNPIDLAPSASDAETASQATSRRPQKPTRKPPSHPPHSSAASDTSTNSDNDTDNDNDTSASDTAPSKPSKSKRNDPTAFANSISAILASKLTTSKRSDPVLSRSTTAKEAHTAIQNEKLETRTRNKLREDKKTALERGRVRDVLLGTDTPGSSSAAAVGTGTGGGVGGEEGEEGPSVGEMREVEKRLRKTAQRGVVKLFNAVRLAQVRGEEAAKAGGGRGRVEERVGEMSKRGFLEMVAAGGGGGKGDGRD